MHVAHAVDQGRGRVRETARGVVVELSSSWPYLKHFQEIANACSQ